MPEPISSDCELDTEKLHAGAPKLVGVTSEDLSRAAFRGLSPRTAALVLEEVAGHIGSPRPGIARHA